ncbi:hypothetical protein [Streptomyces brasiliensis]|uniref:Uncharacterized protein n=1 Tax=Streptomyces brasiliensis TaxID=1954 RepID=A0A917UMC9_9ACTN|nr:hypothetical protein [Streptomyces brasiliensis]GGJ68601.1 hypothetical protein GCM10010121_094170 [Streptomyces brasiliensis]
MPAEPPLLPGTGPANEHAHTLIAPVACGRTAAARRTADGFDLRETPDSWELDWFRYARGVQRAAYGARETCGAGDTPRAVHSTRGGSHANSEGR